MSPCGVGLGSCRSTIELRPLFKMIWLLADKLWDFNRNIGKRDGFIEGGWQAERDSKEGVTVYCKIKLLFPKNINQRLILNIEMVCRERVSI
jgi:hypothetical protein